MILKATDGLGDIHVPDEELANHRAEEAEQAFYEEETGLPYLFGYTLYAGFELKRNGKLRRKDPNHAAIFIAESIYALEETA